MGKAKHLRGAGGGSKKPRTPIESPDSLHSVAYARIVDLVSEGEIVGLVDGLRSVFYNETPLQNADGSLNFNDVQVDSRVGTQDQSYIPGFAAVENEIIVGVELLAAQSWTQAISNTNLSAIRVRLSAPVLTKTNIENGDTGGTSVYYRIEVATDGGPYVTMLSSAFTGKTTSKYERSHRIDLPEATTGWTIRVDRITADAPDSSIQSRTFVESYTEIVDAKLRYPNSAVISTQLDAAQFQSVPSRAYDLYGRIIPVPSNYDPVARTYSGVWDGTFKPAYSNNPAWVYHDLVTHGRFGLGHLIDAASVNKWSLYRIGRYCDELVPDGNGGTEPRFTCNVYLQTRGDAYRVLQDLAGVFRGMQYWANATINPVCDKPEDPVYAYTPANVVDGLFTYAGSGKKARHTVALVTWNDLSDFGRQKVEYVEDPDGIARYGINQVEIIATGCTSRGQARRVGIATLTTERFETDTVSFRVGLDGTLCAPGQVILVTDPVRAGERMGGRIATATSTTVTVDKMPTTVPVAGDALTVVLPNGTTQARNVQSVEGNVITVTMAFDDVPVRDAIWLSERATLRAQRYRVLSVAMGEGVTFEVTALRHEPDKYDFIDFDDPVEPLPTFSRYIPPVPTGLEVTHREVADDGTSMTVVTVKWDAVPGAVDYLVEWRVNQGSWMTAGRVTGTTMDIYGVPAGVFEFRVRAYGPAGDPSPPSGPPVYTVPPNTTPPGAVVELETTTAQIIEDQLEDAQNLADEIVARQQADAQVALDAAQDATDKVAAEAQARADALLNEQLAREAAISNEQTIRQNADDSLAASIALVSAGSGEQFDSKRIWYFDSDLESWSGNGTPTIVDGWLRPANHASEPYVQSPAALGIPGQSYRFAKVRVKKVGNPTWEGRLYWQTDVATWDNARSAIIAEPEFNPDGTATVDWDDIGWWPGTVNRIRLDLSTAQTATDYYLVDWVAIGRPTPGAGVALVQEVQQALVNADSAEALARETLAAQIRGTYTGTDVAQVTQGLVYSERQARVSGDSALATRATNIEARMPSGTGVLATDARVTTVESASVSRDDALGTRATAIEARMPTGSGKLATEASVTSEASTRASADNALGTRTSTIEARMPTGTDTLANEARVVTAEQAAANADNALSGRIGTVEARMPSGTDQLANEARVATAEQARADGDAANAAAITQVQARTAGVVDLRNPSFESNDGWSLPTGVAYSTARVRTGTRALKLAGAETATTGTVGNAGRTAVRVGEKLRAGAYIARGGLASDATARINITVRSYSSTGAYVSGSALAVVNELINSFPYDYSAGLKSGEYTVPEGASTVEVYVSWSNHTVGDVYVDDVVLERITATDELTASATQVLRADVDSVTGKVNASYTVALDANGYHSGVIAQNNGVESSWKFLTDTFAVLNTTGAGLQWTNGTLWNAAGAQSVLTGPALGDNMLFYIGPTPVTAESAVKANAMFYVDKAGNGYFAGRVLQGALRTFNSSTTVSDTASVSVDHLSNNKPCQVKGELNYRRATVYSDAASQITLGNGSTSAAAVLERRYRNASDTGWDGWVTLKTQSIAGSTTVHNDGGGPSFIWHTVQGSLIHTDAADPRRREYRFRLTSITRQPFTLNGAYTPSISNEQYQSIESME